MPETVPNAISMGMFLTILMKYMIGMHGLHTYHDDKAEVTYILLRKAKKFIVLTEYDICQSIPLVLIKNGIADELIAEYRHKIPKIFIQFIQTHNIMPSYKDMIPIIRMNSRGWINHVVPYVVLSRKETQGQFILKYDPSRHIKYVIPMLSQELLMDKFIGNPDLLQLLLINIECGIFYDAAYFFERRVIYERNTCEYFDAHISQYIGRNKNYDKIHNVISNIIRDYLYLFCAMPYSLAHIVDAYLGTPEISGYSDSHGVTGVLLGGAVLGCW